MVMHHFHCLSPSSVSHLEDDFRRALSDQDPGVMEASLILLHDLAKVRTCVCVCAFIHTYTIIILIATSLLWPTGGPTAFERPCLQFH